MRIKRNVFKRLHEARDMEQNIPEKYKKYYEEVSLTKDDIKAFRNICAEYDLMLIGIAIAKDRYYDALSSDGLDEVLICSDETGEIDLYLVIGDSMYYLEDELSNVDFDDIKE